MLIISNISKSKKNSNNQKSNSPKIYNYSREDKKKPSYYSFSYFNLNMKPEYIKTHFGQVIDYRNLFRLIGYSVDDNFSFKSPELIKQ